MSTPETPDAAPAPDAAPSRAEPPLAEPGVAAVADIEAVDAEVPEAEVPEARPTVELTPPAPAALPPAFDPFASSAPAAPAGEPAPFIASAPAAPPASAMGPRVRWAGIVWGLVLAGIAAIALWILTDAGRQASVTAWLVAVTPAAAVAYAVLVVGGFALVAGIVGLARRAQRGAERRRAAAAG